MDKSGIRFALYFLVLFALGVFGGGVWGSVVATVGVVGTAITFFFFRDPRREIPDDESAVVSPADGKVVSVDEYDDPDIPSAKRIAIFMSPLDVHVNRSPTDGVVVDVRRFPGGFKPAFTGEASMSNERVEVLLETPHGMVRVRQIAGVIARRVVCRAKPGAKLRKGERFGIIHFGSRVELVLPQSASVTVNVGERVCAGETVVAVWRDDEAHPEDRTSSEPLSLSSS